MVMRHVVRVLIGNGLCLARPRTGWGVWESCSGILAAHDRLRAAKLGRSLARTLIGHANWAIVGDRPWPALLDFGITFVDNNCGEHRPAFDRWVVDDSSRFGELTIAPSSCAPAARVTAPMVVAVVDLSPTSSCPASRATYTESSTVPKDTETAKKPQIVQ
jgi:hypothetical protein